jgi:hypothetical protein
MGEIDQVHVGYDFAPDGRCLLVQDAWGTCSCWDLAAKKLCWQVHG